MKKSKIFWLLAMALCLGACSKHEKFYNDVTPPVVGNSEYIVTGNVTDWSGNLLSDVTLLTTEGLSVKTNGEGVYLMTVPEPESSKTYTLTASYEDKKDVSKSVTFTKQEGGMIIQKNFRLPSDSTYTIFVGGGGETGGEIPTEFIDHNDFARTLVGAYVDGYEDQTFQLDLFYCNEDFGADPGDENPTSGTFEKDNLFFASSVSYTEGEKNGKDVIPYTLLFNFDNETKDNIVIRSFSNGQWADVPAEQLVYSEEEHVLSVNNALTGIVYAVFCYTTITLTPQESPLSFNPSNVDNTYGTAPVTVPYTVFNYKVGVDLYMATTCQLQALLLEVIARDFGLVSNNKSFKWNVDLTLPIGTGVNFSGNQAYTHIKYKKGLRTAEADLYGDVTYKATTYNHQHVGGGN